MEITTLGSGLNQSGSCSEGANSVSLANAEKVLSHFIPDRLVCFFVTVSPFAAVSGLTHSPASLCLLPSFPMWLRERTGQKAITHTDTLGHSWVDHSLFLPSLGRSRPPGVSKPIFCWVVMLASSPSSTTRFFSSAHPGPRGGRDCSLSCPHMVEREDLWGI